MMDALISSFVSQKKERVNSTSCDETDAAKTTEHIGMYRVCDSNCFLLFQGECNFISAFNCRLLFN